MRLQFLCVPELPLAALAAQLAAIPGLEPLHEGMMWAGGSGRAVTAGELPMWAILRAIDVGVEQAAADLRAFAESGGATVRDCLALAGLKVEQPISVGKDIELVPFAAVPRGPATDHLLGVPILKPPPNSMSFDDDKSPPTAVLMRCRWKAPLVTRRGEPQPVADDYTELADAALALVLLGPTVVLERAFWTWIPESVPLACKQAAGSYPIHEIHVPHDHLKPMLVVPEAVGPVAAFMVLDAATRARLRLPLARLRLSLMRRSVVDQAVELGIAFEALLIGGETKDELLETGKYRAAVLLGGDQPRREQTVSTYEQFYEVRSQAVHTGMIDHEKEHKVKHVGKLRADEVVRRAQVLCSSLLIEIVMRGSFPDWNVIFPKPKDVMLRATLP